MNRAQPVNSLPTGPCHFQTHLINATSFQAPRLKLCLDHSPARPDLPTRSAREWKLLAQEWLSEAAGRTTQVDIKGTPQTMGWLRSLNHGRISQCVSSSSVFSSPPSPSAALLVVRARAARAARPAASDFKRVKSGRPRLRPRRSSRFAPATSSRAHSRRRDRLRQTSRWVRSTRT